MINYNQIVGLVAGTFTTFSTLQQMIKVWLSKSAHDVSIVMFLIAFTGNALWALYAVMINYCDLVMANIISLFLVSCMIIMKLKFD